MHAAKPLRLSSIPKTICTLALGAAILGGCATGPGRTASPAIGQAQRDLKQARNISLSREKSAGLYLQSAEESLRAMKSSQGSDQAKARTLYNTACAEVTVLLREDGPGAAWGKPLECVTPENRYRVHCEAGAKSGVWTPAEFDFFRLANRMRGRHIRLHVQRPGVGGDLVGVQKTMSEEGKKEAFTLRVGRVAAVTSTLEFKPAKSRGNIPHEVTLTLNDPIKRDEVRLDGVSRPLAGDFTAPLAYYPHRNEFLFGLLAMIYTDRYTSQAGLYMLQPYDPDKIPLIFVHGLISTPQMWINTINSIEADPELRRRYQPWVFAYPTGNPVALSAEQLREALADVKKLHPDMKGMVLVGHSMGGLVSRMQATTTGRAIWDNAFKKQSNKLYARLPADNLVKKALIFDANPDVKRIVFIAVPHRGSDLAIGSIGALGTKLVRLPGTLIHTVETTLGGSLETILGIKGMHIPTSIQGLSPRSPALIALNKLPIQAPHHSIIGDRGRGDTPHSSDGVVPYSSSHLDSAKSELIVPGPHACYDLPQTVTELHRILHLHLKSQEQ